MSLTKVSYSMIQGTPLNVIDYMTDAQKTDVLSGTGTLDVTIAVQAAIDAAGATKQLIFPTGVYRVTDTLYLYKGSNLLGANQTQSYWEYSPFSPGTKIVFEPTSPKGLFDVYDLPLPAGAFKANVSVSGMWLVGNTVGGGLNSTSAFNLPIVIYSNFSNLQIGQFRTGFNIVDSINNRFSNIRMYDMETVCVEYSGTAPPTTDVWTQCTFSLAPIGVRMASGIAVRFIDCLWEGLDLYGLWLNKECRNIQATNCYAEDVPKANDASRSMFYVGSQGTTSSLATILQVTGGSYAGRNAGTVGTFLDVYDVVGIQLNGVYVARYTNVIKTSAATLANAVEIAGLQFNSCTNVLNDTTKVAGFYDFAAINGGAGPVARFAAVTAGTSTATTNFALGTGVIWLSDATSPEGVYAAPVGSIFSRTNGGAGTSFYVKESGTGNTGWVGK